MSGGAYVDGRSMFLRHLRCCLQVLGLGYEATGVVASVGAQSDLAPPAYGRHSFFNPASLSHVPRPGASRSSTTKPSPIFDQSLSTEAKPGIFTFPNQPSLRVRGGPVCVVAPRLPNEVSGRHDFSSSSGGMEALPPLVYIRSKYGEYWASTLSAMGLMLRMGWPSGVRPPE